MSYYLNVSSRCLIGLAAFFITNVINPVLEKVQNFSIKIFQKKKDERPNFEGFFDLREVKIDCSDPFKIFFKDLVDTSSEKVFYDGDEVVVSKYNLSPLGLVTLFGDTMVDPMSIVVKKIQSAIKPLFSQDNGEGTGLIFNHPNIIKTYRIMTSYHVRGVQKFNLRSDFSQIEPSERIEAVFMEHLENAKDLFNIIDDKLRTRQVFSFEDIQYIIRSLILANKHLQDRGYFHRDNKLENILLTSDGLKLIDFGLTTNQVNRDLLGSCPYIPPEVWAGIGNKDTSYLWAVGTVLFAVVFLEGLFNRTDPLDAKTLINNFELKYQDGSLSIYHPIKETYLYPMDIPNYSLSGMERNLIFDLIKKLMHPDFTRRFNDKDVLEHPFFKHVSASAVAM